MTEHVRLDDVVRFLDERLEVSKFDEEESNGLIVRASDVVTSIAAAVSTSFHAISRAKSAQADLLIVHHRSWPEIDLELVEEKHTRLRQNGISLYCAHSALDAAPGISNGDGIADATGVRVRERFLSYHGGMAGVIGTSGGTFQEFVDRLRSALGTLVEAHQNSERFGVVAIASGGAPLTTFVQEAAARGADTYVTGEISMYTRMYAKERKINLVAGSHYSTETFGVRALAQLVEARFGIAWDVCARIAGRLLNQIEGLLPVGTARLNKLHGRSGATSPRGLTDMTRRPPMVTDSKSRLSIS